jgi:hypothetical protein
MASHDDCNESEFAPEHEFKPVSVLRRRTVRGQKQVFSFFCDSLSLFVRLLFVLFFGVFVFVCLFDLSRFSFSFSLLFFFSGAGPVGRGVVFTGGVRPVMGHRGGHHQTWARWTYAGALAAELGERRRCSLGP